MEALASMAVDPASRACVRVGPPLKESDPMLAGAFTWSVGFVNGHVAPVSCVSPCETNGCAPAAALQVRGWLPLNRVLTEPSISVVWTRMAPPTLDRAVFNAIVELRTRSRP